MEMCKNYLTAAANLKIEGIVNDINSGDENEIITALRALKIFTKKCYWGKRGIHINADYSNVIPKLVQFLSSVDKPDLQMDSAEVLTNIASGTSDQAKAVVSAGAVAGIISMACSLDPRVAESAGCDLAWLASKRQELCEEIIKPLLMLIKPDSPVTLLQRVIYALITFCQFININPPTFILPALAHSPPTFILPALAHLLHHNDETIITDACHAFIYFQGSDEVIQEVVNAGVVPRLVALLQDREVAIVPCPNHCAIFSILRTIGNITSGTFDQAKAVLLTGLAHLSHHNNDDEILTAACKALSNLEMNIVENKKAAAIESDITALNALSSKTLAILERYLFPTELSNGESKLAPSTS
ncbi:importin subunit alpha-5-like isoform X4 [Daphnia pulex]|uniref:importin subunit alpha-5-like isoform X4 n=1 Tax=Daphnia pulex TaxID=6669 RepID=UPI001EDF3CA8|nr:importin subunit alpha-5-like isoform X4 [Daphnia pulex]